MQNNIFIWEEINLNKISLKDNLDLKKDLEIILKFKILLF